MNNLAPVILARDLRKSFDSFEAVKSIRFDIARGECFGFLGPNGAGKTSTMRMIYCFSPVSAGRLEVMGMDVMRDARKIKAKLGVVAQEDNLDPDLTVFQNLTLYATYFDIPGAEAKSRAEELLTFLSLQEKRNQKIDKLSGGMKRRLMIARALINRPEVLILDEPTTGLDPQARHLIWDKLRALKASGVTMVLTTHYMEEASRLCDRLVIMDHGRILTEGEPPALIEKYVGREVLEIRAPNAALQPLKQAVDAEDGHANRETELVGDTLYVLIREKNGALLEKMPEIQKLDFHLRPASLEDVFLKLAGRELRD
ncbi:MAG TPA: ATP-binding cassette domain-containing protein [bacterium]|nr:ATP-binding cassette domain-containing protein [bacterium]